MFQFEIYIMLVDLYNIIYRLIVWYCDSKPPFSIFQSASFASLLAAFIFFSNYRFLCILIRKLFSSMNFVSAWKWRITMVIYFWKNNVGYQISACVCMHDWHRADVYSVIDVYLIPSSCGVFQLWCLPHARRRFQQGFRGLQSWILDRSFSPDLNCRSIFSFILSQRNRIGPGFSVELGRTRGGV